MSFPDFLVLGAPKAGTTAFCEFLNDHPSIRLSIPKETYYFNRHFGQGRARYRSRYYAGAKERLCGEGTPQYLGQTQALRRIAQEAPEAKLFVLLRDPAKRAFSSWWMRVTFGLEPLGFEAALRVCLEQPDLNEVIAKGASLGYRGYLHYGSYGPQIAQLKSLFPEQQIKIIWSQSLKNDPAKELRRAFEFLALDPTKRKGNLKPRWQAMGVRTARLRRTLGNVSPKLARSSFFHRLSSVMRLLGDQPIRPGGQAYRFLLEYFESSDRELEELLGERPPWRSQHTVEKATTC